MAIRKIAQLGEPVLRQQARPLSREALASGTSLVDRAEPRTLSLLSEFERCVRPSDRVVDGKGVG